MDITSLCYQVVLLCSPFPFILVFSRLRTTYGLCVGGRQNENIEEN